MIKPDTLLVDYALDEIRIRIQSGEYPPGTKLQTQEISESLGISRTPVVAAVNRLVADGFVEATPRKGMVVARLTPEKIREIIDIRSMVEAYVAPKACANVPQMPEVIEEMRRILASEKKCNTRDEYSAACRNEMRFHTLFVSLAKNERLTRVYESNWGIGAVFLMYTLSSSGYIFEDSHSQHVELVNALAARDEQEIYRIQEKHLIIINEALREFSAQYERDNRN